VENRSRNPPPAVSPGGATLNETLQRIPIELIHKPSSAHSRASGNPGTRLCGILRLWLWVAPMSAFYSPISANVPDVAHPEHSRSDPQVRSVTGRPLLIAITGIDCINCIFLVSVAVAVRPQALVMGAAVVGIARGDEYWSVVVAMILFGTAVQFGYLTGIITRDVIAPVRARRRPAVTKHKLGVS
jgi:hypothetical protein